jgi:putative transposase
VKGYEFVEQEKAVYPVTTLCRVLGVSSSGYWAWRRREPSARAHADAQLSTRIVQIHQSSRGTYGAPRIHAELAAQGTRCGRKRVARLMRLVGIAGCHRRRVRMRTTQRNRAAQPAPDLVQRAFVAAAPNELWVSDITYVPTQQEGFLFLAVILDVFSRRVVGWSMADHLRAELVLAALGMAVWNRRPRAGLIHHSDHGCHYTAEAFADRCRAPPASSAPWAPPGTAMITPWRRASLLPWNVNCWIDAPSAPMRRHAVPSLTLSRASIIASGDTQLWGISPQRSLKGGTVLPHPLSPSPVVSTETG